MSTVTTRPLSATRLKDLVSIKVDPEPYKTDCCHGKFGYFKVAIDSIIFTGTGTNATDKVKVDIRPPQYHPDNATPLCDQKEVASNAGSMTPTVAAFITALNNGNPGPSAFAQGDGSWDLLHVKAELPAGTAITNFTVTVTYTLTFVEIDPTALSYTDKTLTVSVTKDRKAQDADISIATQTGNGYLVFQAKKLDTLIGDNEGEGDSVPEFSVIGTPTYTSYGAPAALVQHPTSKSSSASRVYDKKKSTYIVAVNQGKVDGNARKEPYHSGTAGNQFKVCTVVLQKKDEWPCDDDVDATLTFTLDFVSVA